MVEDRSNTAPDDPALLTPYRQIRAVYTDTTITVYQAYSDEIAENALQAQRFVPPFQMSRMTWIKPSFLWMMYRSGWGTKDGQERVLAIDITRSGFQWCLENACLSHFDPAIHASESAWHASKGKIAGSCAMGPGAVNPAGTARLPFHSDRSIGAGS